MVQKFHTALKASPGSFFIISIKTMDPYSIEGYSLLELAVGYENVLRGSTQVEYIDFLVAQRAFFNIRVENPEFESFERFCVYSDPGMCLCFLELGIRSRALLGVKHSNPSSIFWLGIPLPRLGFTNLSTQSLFEELIETVELSVIFIPLLPLVLVTSLGKSNRFADE
jgi:hypothetical protein